MATLEEENQIKFNYLAGPAFKRDLFAGGSEMEKQARLNFYNEQLNTAIVQYDETGAKMAAPTSIRNFIAWYPAGLNTLYKSVLETQAKVDAVGKAVAALDVKVSGLTGGTVVVNPSAPVAPPASSSGPVTLSPEDRKLIVDEVIAGVRTLFTKAGS